MEINALKQRYVNDHRVKALIKVLHDNQMREIGLYGLKASSCPLLFAALSESLTSPLVFILEDADHAGYFYHDLSRVVSSESLCFFPSSYRRAIKYGQRDAANEIMRTDTLSRVQQGGKVLVVTYPEALCELVISQKALRAATQELAVGEHFDVTALYRQFKKWGFVETDYVYEPGQFARRGSLLDIFSFSCETPYRVDFFGDEIESIRTFDVENQLSLKRCERISIIGDTTCGTDSKVDFMSFLPEKTFVVMDDASYLRDKVAEVYRTGFSQAAYTEMAAGSTPQEESLLRSKICSQTCLMDAPALMSKIAAFKRCYLRQMTDFTPQVVIDFDITVQPLFHKNFKLLADTMKDLREKGYQIYLLSDSQKQVTRIHEILNTVLRESAGVVMEDGEQRYDFIGVDQTLHEGFIDHGLKICCFTDHQIFDRFHKYHLQSDRARNGKMALTLKEIKEMSPGDYIVHVDFGIGKFGGLVRVPAGESYQEMIRIIYQRNDKVDVSIHSLYKISKYRRADTENPPRLSTLGTGAWDRMKERTKKKIKDIARDLIMLYAKRRHEKGFAFSPDGFMQHELEAGFAYEDTPDQNKITQEIKSDMEKSRPMDRLVCGDVGFGKTELAIRAALKAACDSKQVAVLVPTTVLAFQHYHTFKDRLKSFPIRVEYLSRARTAKQMREIINDLEIGKIDILIGTHKLISSKVKWHDLGLLVIDEEQKFGVSVKEKLRKIKSNIDTLTMTATPIPRTLQFSLMGARDLSVLRTPPPNRHPIQTEICCYGSEIITEAINYEMSRNGQVYFVNDRIAKLEELKALILKYIPDCRVAIGHGQMASDELEKILIDFINHDYDVLLSTSIIENGIDVPNANTIIINSAHRIGLADLHQMRGRVGRGNRKAFCYLLAPPRSVLTTEARRRLEAIEMFSDLGSGYSIAMQDLDIRGAGNLLGAEQSGFMEELGYETYQKILSQAMTELKNEEFSDMFIEAMHDGEEFTGEEFVEDCALDSDLEMYFPDNYVPGSSERLILYKELDSIAEDRDLDAFRQRMEDRFGPMPREGEELLQVVSLRRLGRKCGCEKIVLKQKRMTLYLVSDTTSAYYQSKVFGNILNYLTLHGSMCELKQASGKCMVVIRDVIHVANAVEILRQLLNEEESQ